MNKKKDFTWRYQPPLDSDRATMLSYIQNQRLHPFQNKTVMIMTALNAYYIALALYSEGSYSRETLELIFLDSVKAIANHLQFVSIAIKVDEHAVTDVLCTVFGGLEKTNIQKDATSNYSTELSPPDRNEESSDSNLQAWNLAGMTTDSETFN
ncbi:MAG: hypothetical protein AAF378_24420 [Cyanobacteria bacterium P01_A01_bin.84]